MYFCADPIHHFHTADLVDWFIGRPSTFHPPIKGSEVIAWKISASALLYYVAERERDGGAEWKVMVCIMRQ